VLLQAVVTQPADADQERAACAAGLKRMGFEAVPAYVLRKLPRDSHSTNEEG